MNIHLGNDLSYRDRQIPNESTFQHCWKVTVSLVHHIETLQLRNPTFPKNILAKVLNIYNQNHVWFKFETRRRWKMPKDEHGDQISVLCTNESETGKSDSSSESKGRLHSTKWRARESMRLLKETTVREGGVLFFVFLSTELHSLIHLKRSTAQSMASQCWWLQTTDCGRHFGNESDWNGGRRLKRRSTAGV